ncbi:MAG: endolytic transglycosylase MltG [Desulfobacterales bacterium]|nr:endolytic transglycosylase MltG [Desulfobacterales bacterium]
MTILGLRLPVFCLFFLGFPLLWLLWIGVYAISPASPSPNSYIDVVIPIRTRVSEIEHILADNKVIMDDSRFSMLVILTGAATKLRAGEYRFETGKKPIAIINLLKEGKVLYRPVTMPEGTEMSKVADILEAEGWIDRTKFFALADDSKFLRKMGIEADSLEGYLFPDTYNLSRGQQDEEGIIRMMVARHFQIYNKLMGNSNAYRHSLSHHEIITLAAIIEKETSLSRERPLIASVFLNRLGKGMRLQADPTVRYGNSYIKGPLRKSELKNSTPYNTYVIKGLPPGPIANPGEAAIQAVIFPAETDYLYFVAKDDSSHHFSRTLTEHNRAVARYRARK